MPDVASDARWRTVAHARGKARSEVVLVHAGRVAERKGAGHFRALSARARNSDAASARCDPAVHSYCQHRDRTRTARRHAPAKRSATRQGRTRPPADGRHDTGVASQPIGPTGRAASSIRHGKTTWASPWRRQPAQTAERHFLIFIPSMPSRPMTLGARRWRLASPSWPKRASAAPTDSTGGTPPTACRCETTRARSSGGIRSASISTIRRSAEDALRRSEARLAAAERELQLTIDTIPTLVATYRPDGSRIFVNQTWRDYSGLQTDDAVDAFRTAVVHPEDAARVLEEWQRCLTSELPFSAEMRLRRAAECIGGIPCTACSRATNPALCVKWYSVGVGIEEQKRSEERLRRSEAQIAAAERELQLTIDTIPTLVATYRPDGSRLFVNQTWLDYTGLSPESAINSERADIVHPDDAARTAQEWKDCLVTGAPFKAEVRLRRADGEYRWHSVHRVLARDETGAEAKWYSVGVDIEEQKRAAERLRESEYNSRLIADSIPGFIIIFTPDGNFEGVNRQTIEYFGKTLDDVTSKRWSTPRRDPSRGLSALYRALQAIDRIRQSLRVRAPFSTFRRRISLVPVTRPSASGCRWPHRALVQPAHRYR